MPTKQYLAIEQVARRLNLKAEAVEGLLQRRELPGLLLGSAWLVPEPELEAFLDTEFLRQNARLTQVMPEAVASSATGQEATRKRKGRAHAVRVTFKGQQLDMPNYASAAIWIIEQMALDDATFLPRFGSVRRGKRRYVSTDKSALYFNRPDLPAKLMENGWWIGTNYSRAELERMLRAACRIAGIKFDVQLQITAAEPIAWSLERARSFIGIAHSGLGDLARRHDEYLSEP